MLGGVLKMTKAKEYRERDAAALTAELAEKHKHMFDLRSQAVTEKLEDPSQLRKTRKEIARIKTVLRERELAEAAAAKKKSESANESAANGTSNRTIRKQDAAASFASQDPGRGRLRQGQQDDQGDRRVPDAPPQVRQVPQAPHRAPRARRKE